MGTQTEQPRVDDQVAQEQQIEQEQVDNGPPNNKCFFFLGDTDFGKNMVEIFQGIHYSIFITVITLITLFLDDVRVIFFTVENDLAFTIITLICMFFFFVELLVFSLFKEGYFLSYYFWLDIVSTLTMVLDLTWVDALLNGGGGIQTAASVAKVARASRASKIGAKATKLIRIIRLIRFLKLYKTASNQLSKDQKNQNNTKRDVQKFGSKNSKFSTANINQVSHQVPALEQQRIKKRDNTCVNFSKPAQVSQMMLPSGPIGSTKMIPIRAKEFGVNSSKKLVGSSKKHRHTQNLKDLAGFKSFINDFPSAGTKQGSLNNIIKSNQNIDIDLPNETRVGSKLKDQIQKNIISMILIIIVSIPLFNANTWFDSVTSYQKGILELENLAQISSAAYDQEIDDYVNFMMNLPSTLVYFQIAVNATCCTFPNDYPSYKAMFKVSASSEYRASDLLAFTTDKANVVVFEATATATLASQLGIGRTLFVCIVLIVSTLLFSRDVQIYALEPLQNMFDTVKRIALNPLNAIRQIQQKNMCKQAIQQAYLDEKQEQTQPNLLENLIVKIGGLLAVGFGQAGTQIISRVIEDPNFVNVIIPGVKVLGIYGFCDIRNFTDATQILQADVMVFVNQIAQICHKVVNAHAGSPNKNIGDAFLLVWKYHAADTKLQQSNGSKKLELVQSKKVKQIADLAVLSFIKMIAQINKSYALLKYKNNKLLKNRIKDYKGVKMGFGLHVGWSIEGPIGSEYKVDASYLSPNVNMANRLEAATKQYGVPMLITGEIYNLMTENKKYLRQVDRVIFPGYTQPTSLYTVDLHIDSLLQHTNIQKGVQASKKQKRHSKVKQNLKRNKLLQDIETKYVTKDLWVHKDIQIMRQRYSKTFYQEWEKGFQAYIDGNWNDAAIILKRTQIMAPDQIDGPSQTIIDVIESCNGKAPEDWKGYRAVEF